MQTPGLQEHFCVQPTQHWAKRIRQNEVEWTGKVTIQKPEFLSAGEACHDMFCPTKRPDYEFLWFCPLFLFADLHWETSLRAGSDAHKRRSQKTRSRHYPVHARNWARSGKNQSILSPRRNLQSRIHAPLCTKNELDTAHWRHRRRLTKPQASIIDPGLW